MENFGDLKTYEEHFEFDCNCGANTLYSRNFALFHLLNLCDAIDKNESFRLSGLDLTSMIPQCEKNPAFKSLAYDFGSFTIEIKRNEYFNCNCGEKMLCSRGLVCNHLNVCKSISDVQKTEYMHLLHEAESKVLKLSIVTDVRLNKAHEVVPSTANLRKPKQWKKVAKQYGEFSSTRVSTEKGSVLKYKFKCLSCNLSINDSKSLVINHLVKGCQEKSKCAKNIILTQLNDLNEPHLQGIEATKTQKQEVIFPREISLFNESEGLALFQAYLQLKITKAKLINKKLDKNLEILKAISNLKPQDIKSSSEVS